MYETLRFRDIEGIYPLTSWEAVITAVTGYLILIFVLHRWMKERQPFKLGFIVPLHNFFLSGISLVILVGVLWNLRYVWQVTEEPLMEFVCDHKRRIATGPQTFFLYLFFLTKFYELLDTVIIVLKKRPIIFLHVYHHCITVVLVFIMLTNEVAVQWIASVANVSVHIPMYYYYAISAMGRTVWWKKYITLMQIIQFVMDMSANVIGFIYYYGGQDCSGALWSWWFGQIILFTFLILFLNFWRHTYTKKDIPVDEAKKSNGVSNGVSNGSNGSNGTPTKKRVKKDD